MIMKEYIARRIVYALGVLFIVATLNFIIFQVIPPYDPVDMLVDPRFSPEAKAQLRKEWGLDQPLSTRYVKYITNLFVLNLGRSFMTKEPVTYEISRRLPSTVLLLGTSFIATVLVGIPIGILAASKRGGKTDVLTIGVGLFTFAAPGFFIQLLFLLVFSNWLGWFPWGQMFPVTMNPSENYPKFVLSVLHHLVLPVASLVVASFGSWALYSRNMLIEALTQDFILTARAKGVKKRVILFGHAFKATLPPIATMLTMSIPGIFTGAVITEFVFTWPGIGRWFLDSMVSRDYPAVQGMLFIYAIMITIANFVADLIYGFLDPRIRVGQKR
jgi:peptide/nickel transport system permease protein